MESPETLSINTDEDQKKYKDIVQTVNEIALYCLMEGVESASKTLQISENDIEVILSNTKFSDIQFFKKLKLIISQSISDIGVQKVSDFLSVSKQFTKLQLEGYAKCEKTFHKYRDIFKA